MLQGGYFKYEISLQYTNQESQKHAFVCMKTHCILRALGHRNTAHDERKESTLLFAFSTY